MGGNSAKGKVDGAINWDIWGYTEGCWCSLLDAGVTESDELVEMVQSSGLSNTDD
jgi:hypothetical protein